MTLAEAAAALDSPSWAHDPDVDVVTALGGKLPVRWEPDDTVCVLRLPADVDDAGPSALYLRIEGRVAREELSSLFVSGHASAATEQAAILEVGLDPPG